MTFWSTNSAPRSDVALGVALTGFGVGQLVVLVLGVLAVTTEFSSGMALVSLTVAPRRARLLLAKTLVVTLYCALLTAVLTVVCALVFTGSAASARAFACLGMPAPAAVQQAAPQSCESMEQPGPCCCGPERS